MPIHVKVAGVWKPVKAVHVKRLGAWDNLQTVYTRRAGTWVIVHAAEVTAVVTANVNNLQIKNLFTAADWANASKKKRVIINSGVVIGDASRGGYAIRTNTGRGSTLVVENNGEIQGFAGLANGGAGGTAFYVEQTGVTIINNWAIRGGGGGGGGGGKGGTGGGGFYSTAITVRDPTSGDYYTPGSKLSEIGTRWTRYLRGGTTGPQSFTDIVWGNNSIEKRFLAPDDTVRTIGIYTYHRSTLKSTTMYDETGGQGSDSVVYNYAVYRTYQSTTNTNTNGGAGGNGGDGGRGQGYNTARQSGSGGSAGALGGTNAGRGGTGGTGGLGGTWGAAGAKGNTGGTGAAGNRTGGAAGTAGVNGGVAGAAIGGPINPTLINNNTINGAT